MVGKLILAVVSEIIDTKNGNNDYKVLVFESTVSENDNEVVILDYEALSFYNLEYFTLIISRLLLL